MQNVILQPIEVGGQTFKNRIMFPPLTTGYEKNGMISEQDMGFYTRLAKGGVGYIVLGDVAPINSFSPTPKLFDDSQIPAFKALADSVHAYGTKLGVQLFHPEYDVDAINSLFMQKKFDEMRQRLHHDMMFFTDEVSEEMLMAIIDKMCACAVRAQKAGVDVIQIHGDRLNGCLCSTRMNHRTDKFGGSLENRVRFARMLTRAIRKAVPDMVIDYKLSIVTPQRGKGGIDEADAVQFAQWLVEDGVDMFHVAQANHTGNMADTIPPMGVQPYGFFVKIAGDIKKAVNVPVSAVGRIVDAEMAERVIESGMADMVAVGRPLLADPDWGTKIAAGKACDIRRCISCNKGCTDAIQNRQFLSCVLNAENGYAIGGEQSGHVILLHHATTGDGELTAGKLLKLLAESGKKMSELNGIYAQYPQVLVNVVANAAQKAAYKGDKVLADFIENEQQKLMDMGRVLVRVSGTEPKIRVMVEGQDLEAIDLCAKRIVDKINERIIEG